MSNELLDVISPMSDFTTDEKVSKSPLETTKEFELENQSSNSKNDFSDLESNELEDDNVYPNECLQSYLVVTGAFFSCFTLFGVMNSMGVIETYVQEHQLAKESVTTISWIFSVYVFLAGFSGIYVGPLYDTFGAKYLVTIGSLLTFAGNISTANSTKIWHFVLSFGICNGIGSGFMMFPTVSVISSWFNKTKRSFFIGVAQCGGSVGGIVFPIMLRSLYPKYGFAWAVRIFALFNLGIDAIAVLLIKDRIKEVREALGEPKDERSFFVKVTRSFDLSAFKDKQFLTLVCGLFMNEFSILVVLTYLSSYAIAYGATESESYLMLTILNLTGAFGKFIPSYFSQFFGTFNMMILMSGTMSLVLFVIWIPFGKHIVALYFFIVIFGFAMAATYSLTGACVGTITKQTKDFGKRYGSAYAFISFANLIALPISSSFIKTKSTSDYDHMAIFTACTCATATIIFVAARYTVVGKKLWKAI